MVVRGHVRVDRIERAGGVRETVVSAPNQLVYGYYDVIIELLGQEVATVPLKEKVHSMWIEMDNEGLPAPAATDTGPHTDSLVLLQAQFADADKTAISFPDSSRGLELRTIIDGTTYAGRTVVAAGLYTRGDADAPPDPTTWVPGGDGVRLVARQLLGPLPVTSGADLELIWTLTFAIEEDA